MDDKVLKAISVSKKDDTRTKHLEQFSERAQQHLDAMESKVAEVRSVMEFLRERCDALMLVDNETSNSIKLVANKYTLTNPVPLPQSTPTFCFLGAAYTFSFLVRV